MQKINIKNIDGVMHSDNLLNYLSTLYDKKGQLIGHFSRVPTSFAWLIQLRTKSHYLILKALYKKKGKVDATKIKKAYKYIMN